MKLKRGKIESINTWFWGRINKIDKPIASLIRIKEDTNDQYQEWRRGHY